MTLNILNKLIMKNIANIPGGGMMKKKTNRKIIEFKGRYIS